MSKKKKNLSMFPTDYIDQVVMDLLYFLNIKMNSENEKETWSSDLEYPDETSICKLYDVDQVLSFSGSDFDVDLLLLDNNKLLFIASEGPNYGDDDLRTYFGFSMYSNASDYVLRKTQEQNGRLTIELNNNKGNVFKYSSLNSYSPKLALINETPIVELLQPIGFKQFYERGHINPEKQFVKNRVK